MCSLLFTYTVLIFSVIAALQCWHQEVVFVLWLFCGNVKNVEVKLSAFFLCLSGVNWLRPMVGVWWSAIVQERQRTPSSLTWWWASVLDRYTHTLFKDFILTYIFYLEVYPNPNCNHYMDMGAKSKIWASQHKRKYCSSLSDICIIKHFTGQYSVVNKVAFGL